MPSTGVSVECPSSPTSQDTQTLNVSSYKPLLSCCAIIWHRNFALSRSPYSYRLKSRLANHFAEIVRRDKNGAQFQRSCLCRHSHVGRHYGSRRGRAFRSGEQFFSQIMITFLHSCASYSWVILVIQKKVRDLSFSE